MTTSWIPSKTVTIANGASLSDAIETNGAAEVKFCSCEHVTAGNK